MLGTPAIWQDTVYAGSATGRLYALDAATGGVRWSFDAASPISGSPTVVAGNVYISTQAKKTFALDALTGAEVWSFDDGRRSSLVADDARAYLSGARILYALEPAPEEDALGEEDSLDDPLDETPSEEPVDDLGTETEPDAGEPDEVISELEPVDGQPAAGEPDEASPLEPDAPADSGTTP